MLLKYIQPSPTITITNTCFADTLQLANKGIMILNMRQQQLHFNI